MKNKIYDIWKNTKYFSVKPRNYFEIYEELFSKYIDKKITFVEIGILSGGSLFMWREFFGKNARIIGVELNPVAKKWEKDGFEIFIGDQGSSEFWDSFFKKVGNIDVVLDDGSHTYQDQIVTLTKCIPFINNGGKMVTEDVCSSYLKRYGYPSKYNFVNFIKLLVDEINYRFSDVEKIERKTTFPLRKKVFSITHYESIVSLNINEMQCKEDYLVKNGGISEGETHVWNYLNKSIIKKILVFFAKKFNFLKKIKIIYILVNKFHRLLDLRLRIKQNSQNKKFFK